MNDSLHGQARCGTLSRPLGASWPGDSSTSAKLLTAIAVTDAPPCPATGSACRSCLRVGQQRKPDRKLKGPFAGLPLLVLLSLPVLVLPDWQKTSRASVALHRAVALCSDTADMLTNPPRACAKATLVTLEVESPCCMRPDRQSMPFWSSRVPTVCCPLALPFAASAVLATRTGRRTTAAA